ncbi:unnamed protein product [Diatraea saccharalis]|uniref:Uncharacterized protein n=1 Tax=Diatraea saccharalis TaxID=40085 RepID=A0A9N9R4W3_9NEOP|nr:unnamed protein product [Diatraea saccharalis]
MSVNTKKGPLYDPGLCRCCGASKKCRLLNYEYDWMGKKEVYSDMFMDCFGLLLSHLDGEPLERLICATCVTRLREATTFREQVLRCEEQLLQARILLHGDDSDVNTNVKSEEVKFEVSVEGEALDDGELSMDYGDDDPSENYKPVQVKSKKSPKQKKKSLKSRSLRKTSKVKKTKKGDSEQEKERAEMLESLSKMNETLQQLQEQEAVKESLKRKSLDKEDKALLNTCVIVENSYVCPFDNSFSDYQCAYCKEVFTDPCKLRDHNLTHDPTIFKEFAMTKKLLLIDILRIDCRLCPSTIDDLDSFKSHITNMHGKQLYDVTDAFLKFKLTLNSLTCLVCNSSFSFFHALKKHMAEHFGTCICDVCGAHYFEERMLTLHQRCHQKIDENFPCKECGKNFKSKYSRRLHITKMHNKEPAYECYKCGEVFFSYSLRYRHMIDVHGENRMFQCEHCDRVYDSRKSLREHNRRFHLKILKHQCDLCEKRFYLPSRLKEHMAVHTGERNFRCEYCGKSYPRLRGLKVHMQSHSSDKKFKCLLCSASFTQNVNLKNHMKRQHQSLDIDEGYR